MCCRHSIDGRTSRVTDLGSCPFWQPSACECPPKARSAPCILHPVAYSARERAFHENAISELLQTAKQRVRKRRLETNHVRMEMKRR